MIQLYRILRLVKFPKTTDVCRIVSHVFKLVSGSGPYGLLAVPIVPAVPIVQPRRSAQNVQVVPSLHAVQDVKSYGPLKRSRFNAFKTIQG